MFDLSPETLEFELRALISDLADAKRPCVFVIDELDKLDVVSRGEEEPDDLESHVIFYIVSILKNFFTLGTGIYVFIAGEDFYSKLSESIAGGDYSLAHTLFTDRLFIHILHYEAIEKLIDSMIEGAPSDTETYEKFKNYLCWESRNHVFDLLSLIEEFVTHQDGRPVLIVREEGEEDGRWHSGNIPKDWQEAAGLQKYAGAVYDESRHTSARKERYNHSLWVSVTEVLRSLYDGGPVDIPEEYSIPDSRWTAGLSTKDRDDLSGAIERLVAKLERHGAVSREQTSETDDEEERSFEVVRYTLYEKMPYPPATIGTESTLIPIEKSLIELTQRVKVLSENLDSAGLGVDAFDGELRSVEGLSRQVQKTGSRSTVPRSQTREGIAAADDLAKRLVEAGVNGAIELWAANSELNISRDIDEPEPRTGEPWKSSLTEFEGLLSVLSEDGIDYHIVGGTSEYQLLVIDNSAGEELVRVSDAYSKALPGEKGRERRKQRLPVLIVDHSEDGDAPKFPQEVIRETEDELGTELFFWRWLQPRKARQRTEQLAGWNVFSLRSDLSNLSQLGEEMTKVSYITEQS